MSVFSPAVKKPRKAVIKFRVQNPLVRARIGLRKFQHGKRYMFSAIDRSQPWLGLYLPDDFSSATQRAEKYSSLLDTDIRILSFYIAWGSANQQPDLVGIQEIIRNGFIPMITWEPWNPQELPDQTHPETQPEFSLSEILRGRYDDYIRKWACALKEISGPQLLFRPMHEMNGNWYPWCGKSNGNHPSEYSEVWRYIRSIFREVRSGGLTWVWSPHAHSVPDERDHQIREYFPGAAEVDCLALDGYNWGTTRDWSSWQSFEMIFEKGYDELTRLAPELPVMVAEVGCAEQGGDKGSWLEAAITALREKFLYLNGVVWFNVSKECDWRIESSQNSMDAFKKNWKYRSRHFQNRTAKGV